MSLEKLFTPHSVAVIGSMSSGKLGYVLLKQIIDGGFAGNLYAVNPKAQGAFSVEGFDAVASIRQPVDLAIVACPAASVISVMQDCGKSGVRAAVVITAGFSEIGNRQGEEELMQVARRYDIRVVGPNCAGIVNTHHHLYPTLEWRPPAGGVALISQSGALGGVVLAWAAEQGLGISKFVSYGNGADLSQVDLLHYLSGDLDTKVVALYVESVPDGRAFMEALASCAACKPVIVIKAGRTGVGKRATASHTGSMAGSDAVYDAAIRECGAIRVKTVEEMLDLCRGFIYNHPMHGKRVAIVTNSGGPAVLAADYGEELGLEVAEPSNQVKEQLRQFLSPNVSLKNPIDLTVEGTEEGYRKVLTAVLEEFDAAVAMNICPPYLDSMGLAKGVLSAAEKSGKPVVANFLPPQVVETSVDYLRESGMVNYTSGEKAVTVLSQMARYYAFKEQLNRNGFSLSNYPGEISGTTKDGLFLRKDHLLEPEAMAWLQKNGIPVPEFRQAFSAEEAAELGGQMGYPVVMKVVSKDILHKSDVGGVVLNIGSRSSAISAFKRIQKAADGADFQGVVIYPMIRNAQEVIVGLYRDPQFGPVLMFGLGGIYTEIWKDISLRVAPVNHKQAWDMIHEIRSVRILEGARGGESYDLGSLADLIVNFSELPFTYPEIGEIDLNPVFVFKKGVLVGDARVIRKTIP
jgi:acetyltransferase